MAPAALKLSPSASRVRRDGLPSRLALPNEQDSEFSDVLLSARLASPAIGSARLRANVEKTPLLQRHLRTPLYSAFEPTFQLDGRPSHDGEGEGDSLISNSAPAVDNGIRPGGLLVFYIQQFISIWGFRMAEFAIPLFLITYFTDTLLPTAIYGFTSCLTNILLSQYLGSLVDRVQRLTLLRVAALFQRLSTIIAYSSFTALFYYQHLCLAQGVPIPHHSRIESIKMPQFQIILFAGALLQASNMCATIAVVQDWVPALADTSAHGEDDEDEQSQRPASTSGIPLSALNANLKRVDLACKLLAPLFVSVLSMHFMHPSSTSTALSPSAGRWIAPLGLAALMFVCGLVDQLGLGVVWRLLPRLHTPRAQFHPAGSAERSTSGSSLVSIVKTTARTWGEFWNLPTFSSSLSAALLMMSVLSFEGAMITFLKTQHFSDTTVSVMRSTGVLTSFLGTLLSPVLERRLGSVRAGSWSLMIAVGCLVPALFGLEVLWGGDMGMTLLVSGIALSSIGLASFELVQTKQLQMAIMNHPKKSTLASLQFTLVHTIDLMKYVLTMFFFPHPHQFKYTALISFGSILAGCASYVIYARRASDEGYGESRWKRGGEYFFIFPTTEEEKVVSP